MGTSKAELFGARVFDAAGDAFDDVIAVDRAFEGPHDDEGPIFGVLAALRDASSRCFILAVDYPLITAPVLRFLRDRFEETTAPMLVPQWDDEPQLLCAGYLPSLRELIERRIERRLFDLRGLIADAGAEIIPESELRRRFPGEPLMNVNTPDERRKAERIDGQR